MLCLARGGRCLDREGVSGSRGPALAPLPLAVLFQLLRLTYFLLPPVTPGTLHIGFLAPGQGPWVVFDTLLWLLCVRLSSGLV